MKFKNNLIFIFLISIFYSDFSNAQTYELGFYAGKSNFIGDVGGINLKNVIGLTPVVKDYVFGLSAKWNRSPRHSYRFTYISGDLGDNDLHSKDPRRQERGYNFNINFSEISLGMEFTFLDFNLHERGVKFTPFIYGGLTYSVFDKLSLTNSLITQISGNTESFGIPFGIGLKYRIFDQIIISAELGARYMFTDNIDGSFSNDENISSFGNVNNNDWYLLSLINLSYTFGKKPCYCNY